eukprot:5303995-Prymnesium_polylepis.1
MRRDVGRADEPHRSGLEALERARHEAEEGRLALRQGLRPAQVEFLAAGGIPDERALLQLRGRLRLHEDPGAAAHDERRAASVRRGAQPRLRRFQPHRPGHETFDRRRCHLVGAAARGQRDGRQRPVRPPRGRRQRGARAAGACGRAPPESDRRAAHAQQLR